MFYIQRSSSGWLCGCTLGTFFSFLSLWIFSIHGKVARHCSASSPIAARRIFRNGILLFFFQIFYLEIYIFAVGMGNIGSVVCVCNCMSALGFHRNAISARSGVQPLAKCRAKSSTRSKLKMVASVSETHTSSVARATTAHTVNDRVRLWRRQLPCVLFFHTKNYLSRTFFFRSTLDFLKLFLFSFSAFIRFLYEFLVFFKIHFQAQNQHKFTKRFWETKELICHRKNPNGLCVAITQCFVGKFCAGFSLIAASRRIVFAHCNMFIELTWSNSMTRHQWKMFLQETGRNWL